MQSKPYVGITGPVNVTEVKNTCNEFFNSGYTMESSHIPMLGFLISYKTLNGQPTENRRYPKISDLPQMLEETYANAFAMIHYNSRELDTLNGQISKIFEMDDIYDNGLCKALQLNIPWPDIKQIKKIKEDFPKMEMVFQVSHKMTEGKNPADIASGIVEYGNCINYVLIDPSGGRGMPFDITKSCELYSNIKNINPELTIGFAGGLSGQNVASVVTRLAHRLGRIDFCIDAEGGLRDKITDAYGDDVLNKEKVRSYLQGASSVLR